MVKLETITGSTSDCFSKCNTACIIYSFKFAIYRSSHKYLTLHISHVLEKSFKIMQVGEYLDSIHCKNIWIKRI